VISAAGRARPAKGWIRNEIGQQVFTHLANNDKTPAVAPVFMFPL
jgi:hypothetical protein